MNFDHSHVQSHSMNSPKLQDNSSSPLQSTVYIKSNNNNTILVQDKVPVDPTSIRKFSICKQQASMKKTKLKIGGNEPCHSYDISFNTSGNYINIWVKPGREYHSDANGYITIILHELGSIIDNINLN